MNRRHFLASLCAAAMGAAARIWPASVEVKPALFFAENRDVQIHRIAFLCEHGEVHWSQDFPLGLYPLIATEEVLAQPSLILDYMRPVSSAGELRSVLFVATQGRRGVVRAQNVTFAEYQRDRMVRQHRDPSAHG
jgi:hypothetical protein